MIYSIAGRISLKEKGFVVVDVHGVSLRAFLSGKTLTKIPSLGDTVKLYTHFRLRDDGADLYGFLSRQELDFFELLISVSGVGPKSALAVLDIAELTNLLAAVKEGRSDLLTRASGIGRKTAERIIVELRNKVQVGESEVVVKRMESDADLAETLVDLGYSRASARAALEKVGGKTVKLEDRLKEALKVLSHKRE